jgi:hypothetical protein
MNEMNEVVKLGNEQDYYACGCVINLSCNGRPSFINCRFIGILWHAGTIERQMVSLYPPSSYICSDPDVIRKDYILQGFTSLQALKIQ